jgi:hypothetical protein
MRIVAFILEPSVIDAFLPHLCSKAISVSAALKRPDRSAEPLCFE